MTTLIEEKVAELRDAGIDHIITAEEAAALDKATRYTLADAVREGSTVSPQAVGWCDADGGLCAMSAAVVSATARGYMK